MPLTQIKHVSLVIFFTLTSSWRPNLMTNVIEEEKHTVLLADVPSGAWPPPSEGTWRRPGHPVLLLEPTDTRGLRVWTFRLHSGL